jgi:hypothetical protein
MGWVGAPLLTSPKLAHEFACGVFMFGWLMCVPWFLRGGPQKDLHRVLELNPRHHNAHILMASLYMISNSWAESATHFEQAFSLVPSCMDEKLLYQHG